MSLRLVLDAVKSIAGGTGKIAKLYEHQVRTSDDADLITLFKDATNGRIDTAMITRTATQSKDVGVNQNYDYHTIAIDWYRSCQRAVDDSTNSEDGFQDDVETVRLAFNRNRKLTVNGAGNAQYSDPMQAEKVGYVMFCAVLCHYVRLTMLVKDGPNQTTSI